MNNRAVMQQALEALELIVYSPGSKAQKRLDAVAALRAALTEPVQEPVAWIQPDHLQKAKQAPFLCRVEPTEPEAWVDFVPLYTAPPQPEAAAVAEPISVVAVAEVVDREEGPDLNWLLEGGIYELPAGVVLLMSDKPLTDADGHGHVYAAPPQRKPLTDEEIRRMKPISPDLVDFRSGVRCAERAHGIGGSDE